jgi:RNA polymerase sigma-70 factor (ECF subfamily)
MCVADSAAEARIDQALVTRVQRDGDRRAFEQLVRRHQGMVRAQLRRLLHGDDAAADDMAQETFMLAWRNLDKFRGEARFSSWLYRIAYTCFLQARRTPVRHDGVDDEMLQQLEGPKHAMDLQLDLKHAMQRLSTAEQAVLLHCAQMGLSHEEAAYVLAMPLGTVKTHATRGKAKLKAWLADWRDASTEEIS